MYVCVFVLHIKVTMERPILSSGWAHQFNSRS